MNSKLREALYVYMNKHGNTLCQWKNNDYEFAQSLPESQQEEIVPELLKAIRQAVAEEMLELIENEPACWEHNEDYKGVDGIEVGGRKLYPCYTNELAQEINFKLAEFRQKIKQWAALKETTKDE